MKTTKTFSILIALLFLFSHFSFSQQSTGEQIKQSRSRKTENKKSSSVIPPHISTSSYNVATIPYAPYSFEGNDSTLVNEDDVYSPVIDIGFDFCFFGASYHYLIIGANGEVTFDTSQANFYDEFEINGPLQNTYDVWPGTICAVYRDVDPSLGGKIYYSRAGAYPNRLFIVNWNDIPLFEDGWGTCDGSPHSTFQLVMEESTGNIRVYVHDSYSCTDWNGGWGIIGVLDYMSNAVTAPNRDYPLLWSANDEGWQFTPTSTSCVSGIDENARANPALIYPNPTKGFNMLKTKSYIGGLLEVYDAVGQKIISKKIIDAQTAVDLRNCSDGIYLMRIFSANGTTIQQEQIIKE